ncbi:MAG: YkgJ family cysteine cluster protein [Thiobacillaceae bacterium]|nr:YkgJ family cysteine cluster protein [Thiobacillaceae bacterium]MDW8323307.1 YkgJ family cysteine cluster protein [Burkholderiales bacterium]
MDDYDAKFRNLAKDSPIPAAPVMPNLLGGEHVIQFRCHRGVKCWNVCCSNIDITLTPYDILRLKNRLGLSSGEFLQRYTVPYEMDKDGMPGVKLRAVEGGTACQFMVPEGCSVYEDRPTACRYYPLALMSLRRQDEYVDRQAYALVKEETCLGHLEGRKLTIDAYRQEQGVAEYDEKGRAWRQLVLKRKSAGPSIGRPTPLSNQLFFMASYDLDRFRAFVMSPSFNDTYEVPVETMAEIVADDEKLLDFAMNFLKQVLFNEPFLTERPGAYERRVQRLKEKAERMRAEFEANRERLEDEKYSDYFQKLGGGE